ncbi:MAG TPA: aquaporin [Thermoplasmata archaeon]|nr:aquaporin [Thermoplasmata archaeon]
MAWTAGQRYLAEFVGTFGLVISVGGAAVFTSFLTAGFDSARVLLISAALGTGVIGMIYALGDISGAHFNPAVTIAFWVSGRFHARDVVPYIVAQVLGGVLAMAVVIGIVAGNGVPGVDLAALAHANGFASQGYTGNGSPYTYAIGSVFLLELVFTFFLVFVILFATRAEGSSKNLAPLGIGLTLLMTNLVAIPVDGASVNPARSFAPAILAAYWSGGQWAIQQDWLFWLAPILGGVFAAMTFRLLAASSSSS